MKKPVTLAAYGAGFALLLAGCVPPAEWTRERQTTVTTRDFSSVSPEQLTRAAENVLRLADGGDVSFDFRDAGFRAARPYSVYFVIGAAQGTYIFDFAASRSGGSTRAELKIYAEATSFTAVGPIPTSASLWELEGAYQLFFDRLSATLEGGGTWTTCQGAPTKFGHMGVHFEPLCVGATDSTPQ